MAKPIVDTHIHIWDLGQVEYPWLEGNTTILNRTYELKELEPLRAGAGVTQGVLIQAANNIEDTDLMLTAAYRHDWISGVVGWVPLLQPGVVAVSLDDGYGADKYFKGVRHLIHDEPDERWLLQEPVLDSLRLLAERDIPYDLVGVKPGHLRAALEVAEKVSGLKIVLDHLNQPGNNTEEWKDLMKAAAGHGQFFAKISGLGAIDDIKPYLGFVLDHFGTDRCFCGGDWPVSLLSQDYAGTWEKYKRALSELVTPAQRDRILYDNAVAFYQL